MKSPASSSRAIACLRYRDAHAAIDWLCAHLGFARQAVYPGPGGSVAHAQLTLGGGMIMLGSVPAEPNEFSRLVRQPDEVGGIETQSVYLVVADADAVYARVKSGGGQIVIEIHDEDYGGRGFACRDPEGHLWYVGTYDPWAAPPAG